MKRVLIYSSVLRKPSSVLGGTGRALVNRAAELTEAYDDIFITLCGSDMGEFVQINPRLVAVQAPCEKDYDEFLKLFDTVVFASNLDVFVKSKKPPGQRWILDLHFWNIEEHELARARDFDLICTASEIHQETVSARIGGVTPVDYVYNSVDCEHFRPDPTVPRPAHSLMYAGAIVPHKGVEKAIQTAVVLAQELPDLTLNIYGSADIWRHGSSFEDQLRDLSPPYVRFHGASLYAEMPKAYSANSVLILPSNLESFGLVTIEAQACGCIPVVHRCGGTAATLDDGITGILYSPNDLETLVSAVRRALAFGEAQRSAAREFVKNRFSPRQLAERYYTCLTGSTRT